MTDEDSRTITLSNRDYEAIRELIGQRAGIELGEHKRDMVYARLARRLRTLGLSEFSQYIRRIETDNSEVEHFINSITTNLTSFFRESYQLDVFANKILPELLDRNRTERVLRIWSAGCSTGQEPYTLAIILNEVISDFENWDVKILATDLDTDVLAKAKAGVYPAETIEDLSSERQKRWFQAAPGTNGSEIQVAPALQNMIRFRQLNFMKDWPFKGPFGAIFCRNVLIYFDHPTQMWLIDRFVQVLGSAGYLLLGHSETLRGRQADQLATRGQNTYQKVATTSSTAPSTQPRPLFGFAHLERRWDDGLQHCCARIQPGEYYVTKDDEAIITTLGSCIAVCMRDPVAGIGGMNHFLLPAKMQSRGYALDGNAANYGNFTMEQLINEILKHGGTKHRLEVKIFGGSRLLTSRSQLGELTADFVCHYMAEERLRVSAQDLAGEVPRKICYFPSSGRVLLKKLDPSDNDRVHGRESQYLQRLNSKPIAGDVELF